MNRLLNIYWWFLLAVPTQSFAHQTATFGWEKTAQKITNSLTGPMAYSLSILALAICGLFTMYDLAPISRTPC